MAGVCRVGGDISHAGGSSWLLLWSDIFLVFSFSISGSHETFSSEVVSRPEQGAFASLLCSYTLERFLSYPRLSFLPPFCFCFLFLFLCFCPPRCRAHWRWPRSSWMRSICEPTTCCVYLVSLYSFFIYLSVRLDHSNLVTLFLLLFLCSIIFCINIEQIGGGVQNSA